MRYRRAQLGRNVVTTEGRHYDGGEGAGHDGQQHAAPPGRFQRAAEHDNCQHGAQRKL
jgi:hypothetical protein